MITSYWAIAIACCLSLVSTKPVAVGGQYINVGIAKVTGSNYVILGCNRPGIWAQSTNNLGGYARG